MKVKQNHPLAELLAKKLFGIECVPKEEQTKMVQKTISEVVKWYEDKKHFTDCEIRMIEKFKHGIACQIIYKVLEAFKIPNEQQCVVMWKEAEIAVKELLDWYVENILDLKERND